MRRIHLLIPDPSSLHNLELKLKQFNFEISGRSASLESASRKINDEAPDAVILETTAQDLCGPYLSFCENLKNPLVVILKDAEAESGIRNNVHIKAPVIYQKSLDEHLKPAIEKAIQRKKGVSRFQEQLLSHVREPIIVTDTKGEITYWSKGAAPVYGYSADEILGQKYDLLFHPHDVEKHPIIMQEVKETGEWVGQLIQRRKDGSFFTVDSSISLINDQYGIPDSLVFINRDITEIKKYEADLSESERRMSTLLANLPGMAYRCLNTPRWPMQFVSEGCFALTGFKAQELTGQKQISYGDIVHPNDRLAVWNNVQESLIKQEHFEMQYRIVTKDGVEKWVWEQGRGIFNDKKELVALEGFITDITETIWLENERHAVEAQLRQSQKLEAIGTLAGGVAHDFNNILGAITGYMELTLLDISNKDKAEYYLNQALSAANRAKTLVSQILTFSRKHEKQLILVNITPIVKEALKFLRSSLPSTIKIVQKINPLNGGVLADPTQIHQVIMNLCTNASHAMREKGGVLEVKLEELSVINDENELELEEGNYVQLTISDTGHGISQKNLEKIFDPYFTTKKQGEGTGLGLAVVQGIVKNCGGLIEVSSQPTQGTTFQIYLPLISKAPSSIAEQKPSPPKGTETILFVDDEVSITEVGKKLLEHLGYSVEIHTNSLDALEAVRSGDKNFDLIITDQTMPHLTGDELARRILKIKPDMPIIICTGFSESIDEEKSKQIGIKAFLMKPLELNELAAAVREVMDAAPA